MVNIKEFAEKESRLASGHRSCAGCAFPIIIRTVMKATGKDLVVSLATGCLEVTTTIFPQSSWKVPAIHNTFLNASSTLSGVEGAYKALKRQGKIKKEIKFLAFGGDGGTYDIGLQSLSGALEREHDFVYVLYDNEAYMNCLSRDSLIMTKEGLKKITAIKKGEKIFAFNQKNQTPVLKKCTGIFNNGVKKIYELATLHYSIKATSNHPFLVLKRNGRGKKSHFIWKTLGKLKKGDEVVVQNSNLIKGQSFKFKPIKVSKKGDYKVNRINNVKLPKQSSPGLMEILGLYVGDGWIRVKKGEVGFALPRETKGSKRLIKLYKKLFGKDIIQKEKNYIHIYSVNLARFIKSLNFGTNAKTKIVPPWIFTLPTNEKEAFVKGLMLSDGYKINNSCRYVSASIDLLKSLRILLQSIDYRVGKIHKQTKTKGTFCVYRKLLEDSYYGYICFSKKSKPNISKYLSQTKQRDFLADNEKFSTEKIKSIKFIREEPTLDLRVEGEHNFIADGFVVHNTGNQRSSATPFGAATTTTPTGKVKQGKEQFHKDITKIVAAHNIPYVAQASPHNWQDLYNKAKKAFEIKGPAFINVLSPCQLNWKFPMEQTIKIAELATETNFWPLYEIENGKYKINYKPENPKPIEEFLKLQKRFKHLFKEENKHILKQIQENVNKEWQKLLALASEK